METRDDLNRFKEMLHKSTKEQFIEIIANKAVVDSSFELYVNNYLSVSESADDVLKMFLKFCERSRNWKEPDIDIIEEGGSLFMEKMEGLPDSVGKIKAYILAINEIDALLNEGAGMYNDDDWIIVEIAKKCIDKVLEICTSACALEDKNFLAEAKQLFDTIDISTGCTCLDKEVEKLFCLLNKN